MAAIFTINITVGAGGVVNALSVFNQFQNSNGHYQDSDYSFNSATHNVSSATINGNVVITETAQSFTYDYGYYHPVYDNQGHFLFYGRSQDTQTAERTTNLTVSGN